jgi:hypothetical protein
MEDILSRVFNHPDATQLKFIYYKQHHVYPPVFLKAAQMQWKHKQSHQVIAVEGLHPDQHFEFELALLQKFPQISALLPTSSTHQPNFYSIPKGRYNLLTLMTNFASLAQQVAKNFPAMYYQHLKNQGINFQEETFQAPRVVSRLPRLDDSFGSSLSFDSRSPFFTSTASYYDNIQLDLNDCDEYPPVVEAIPRTIEPSVASGISSTVWFGDKLPPERAAGSTRVYFDNLILFGSATPILESPPSSALLLKSTKKQPKCYFHSRWLYLVQHNWIDRLQQAMSSASMSTVFLEALDRDLYQMSLSCGAYVPRFSTGALCP